MAWKIVHQEHMVNGAMVTIKGKPFLAVPLVEAAQRATVLRVTVEAEEEGETCCEHWRKATIVTALGRAFHMVSRADNRKTYISRSVEWCPTCGRKLRQEA